MYFKIYCGLKNRNYRTVIVESSLINYEFDCTAVTCSSVFFILFLLVIMCVRCTRLDAHTRTNFLQ